MAEGLSLDGEPEAREVACPTCGTGFIQTIGFVLADGTPHAIYYAGLHHHDGQHDAWLDVVLGSWPAGEDEPYPPDHVTFSCRVGPGAGATENYASLVQAPAVSAASNVGLFGRLLSREDALAHARLAEFWRVVDLVVSEDRHVRGHLQQ